MTFRWILVTGFLFIANMSFGQSPVPNLQGYVYVDGSQRVPVEGATVSAGASARASKTTDRDGHFALDIAPGVRAGDSIRLRVEKPGFRPWALDMGLSDIPVIVNLVSTKAAAVPNRTYPKPQVETQRPTAPLWKPTDDALIDSVEARLNTLSSQSVTDAQIIGVLRGLFDAPIFSYLGEELPEDALYRFCRNERILQYYGSGFGEPNVRTAISTASQNLIYLQDIFGDLYGPAFSANEQCDSYGNQTRSEYKSHLGPRIKDRNSLDVRKAERLMNSMLSTLASIGMASPPKVPPSVPSAEADGVARLQPQSTIPDQSVVEPSANRVAIDNSAEKCVAFYALTLFVAPQQAGFEITDAQSTIPVLFKSRTSADIFLRDARRHSGACLTSNSEVDLQGGYDAFIIWQDAGLVVGPGYDPGPPIDRSPLPNSSQLGPNFGCVDKEHLRFDAKNKNGPFSIFSDKTVGSTAAEALLIFNSPTKARRVFDTSARMAAELCVLSISDSSGNELHHPVVAYFRY